MIGDLLLTWMSETGSGNVSDFRSRAAWLARTENMNLPDYSTRRWLRDASSLGHCEVDWRRGAWAVAPPVIARLRLADGLAVLVGSRRRLLLRAISRADIYIEQATRQGSEREIPAPTTILIPFEDAGELELYSSTIGARYVGCAAAEIASLLPSNEPFPLTAPPAYSSTVERLIAVSPQNWNSASARTAHPIEGLYREQVNGRWRYALRRSEEWYSCDLSSGIFAELARRGEGVIRWRPEHASRSGVGTVSISGAAPLPPLHARALVLCGGFPPRFDTAAETATAVYDNVPHEIAVRVSVSLGQQLQITH